MKVKRADKAECAPRQIHVDLLPQDVFKLEAIRFQNVMRKSGKVGPEKDAHLIRRCIDMVYAWTWFDNIDGELDVELDEFIDG